MLVFKKKQKKHLYIFLLAFRIFCSRQKKVIFQIALPIFTIKKKENVPAPTLKYLTLINK